MRSIDEVTPAVTTTAQILTNGHAHQVNPFVDEPQGSPPDRERIISRLAVLNTAVSILSGGGRTVDVGQVLEVAAQLERWAHRPA